LSRAGEFSLASSRGRSSYCALFVMASFPTRHLAPPPFVRFCVRSGTRVLAWPEAWAALTVLVLTPWHARALIGDAAVYASTILDGRFFERSIHVGYYAVGWLFWKLLAPFGVHVDQALVILAPLTAIAAAGACWRFLRALGESRASCGAGMLVFALSGVMLRQATWPEIYAIEIALLLWSWTFTLRGRPVLAGVLFGAALLVTPLSAFGGGVFLWDAWRRRDWRPLVTIVALAAGIWALVIGWCWHDYFWGTRGLLSVGPNRVFGWRTGVANLVALGKNLHVFLPLLPFGLAVMAQQRDPRLSLVLLCAAAQILAFLGMREDGVFMIAVYPLLALAIARALETLWQARRSPAAPAIVAATGGLYLVTGILINLEVPDDTYRNELARFLRDSGRNTVLIASWDHMMSIRLYAQLWGRPDPDSPRIINEELLTPSTLRELGRDRVNVVALEHFYPSRLVRALAPRAALERRYEQKSLIGKLRRMAPDLEATPLTHHPDGPDFYRVRWTQVAGDGGAPGTPIGAAPSRTKLTDG
jgi:Glycosyltransferase family 87